MQASCKQNINDSFQILRPRNFVHVVHQIGGVLYNPPTTKHGGSSSSTLVMTTSLTSNKYSIMNKRLKFAYRVLFACLIENGRHFEYFTARSYFRGLEPSK